MLKRFSKIRALLTDNKVDRSNHWITGKLALSEEVRLELVDLDQAGYVPLFKIDNQVKSVVNLRIPSGETIEAVITLKRGDLQYFEDVAELIHTGNKAEPLEYIVHGMGEFQRNVPTQWEKIILYRQALRARRLIELVADHRDADRAFILAPKKLEFRFHWKAEQMRNIECLESLEKNLAAGVIERDQRLALFYRNLYSRLSSVNVDDRFAAFMDRTGEIAADFNQDYQLWLGTTFTEIQKSFEEKRLKFITELTAILTGIQASILALPIAALLAADKYDVSSPGKDIALASGITALGAFTWKLLANQKHALDATAAAIVSVKEDFTTKNPNLTTEVATRLTSVFDQKQRVENLVRALRIGVPTIVLIAWLAVTWSFVNRDASNAASQSSPPPGATAKGGAEGTIIPPAKDPASAVGTSKPSSLSVTKPSATPKPLMTQGQAASPTASSSP